MAAADDEDEPPGIPLIKPNWMLAGKCRGITDSTLFYPERSNGEVQQACRICNGGPPLLNKFKVEIAPAETTCPVRDTCLEWGLEHDEFGVWGGTSERERRRIKKQRRNRAS